MINVCSQTSTIPRQLNEVGWTLQKSEYTFIWLQKFMHLLIGNFCDTMKMECNGASYWRNPKPAPSCTRCTLQFCSIRSYPSQLPVPSSNSASYWRNPEPAPSHCTLQLCSIWLHLPNFLDIVTFIAYPLRPQWVRLFHLKTLGTLTPIDYHVQTENISIELTNLSIYVSS